jgi:hypothetical protein
MSVAGMPPDMTHVDATVSPRRRRRRGPKPRQPFDKRTLIGRRVQELVAVFSARIGPGAADPVTAAAIARAAETQALAESARARALRADATVTLDDVVRLNRLAEHAVRALRLDRHNATQQPTLSEYLRSRSDSGGMP